MDLSGLSVEDLKALQSGKLDNVSIEGLNSIHQQMQQRQQATQQAQNPQQLPDAVDKAAQGGKDNAQPISLTLNKQFPSSYNGGGMTAAAAQANPGANEGFAKVGTGLALGGAAGAAADALGGGMAANAGANAGASGLQKYLSNLMDKNPDSTQGVVGNAVTGGVMSAGLDSAGKLFQLLKGGAVKAGTSLTGVTPYEGNAYAANPKLAEQMYGKVVNDPNGLDTQATGELKTALDRLQSQVINPKMSQVNLKAAGLPNIQVNPQQYAGTSAGSEIERAFNTQGKTVPLDVPTGQLQETATVNPEPQFSKPETQTYQYDSTTPHYGDNPTADVSQVSYKGVESGRGALFTPGDTQKVQVPAPMGDSVSLTGPQALSAQRASSAASNIVGKNPLQYTPEDSALALKNSQAAVNIKKAIANNDPKIAELNSDLSDLIRQKQAGESLGNPSRIYYSGESVGSVPVRGLQQTLDENTGSNFQEQAKALAGGKAVMGRANGGLKESGGLVDRLLAQPIGRQLLKQSGLFDGAANATSAVSDPSVLQGLVGLQKAASTPQQTNQ